MTFILGELFYHRNPKNPYLLIRFCDNVRIEFLPLRYYMNKQNSRYDVIVIGAGTAGISAAAQLKQTSKDILILEARNRIGGRIWSEITPKGIVDLGASWIEGITNNPIYAKAKQHNIKLVSTDLEYYSIYNHESQALSDEQHLKIKHLNNEFDHFLDHREFYYKKDRSLEEAIKDYVTNHHLSEEDIQLLYFIIRKDIASEYAANLANMSLLYFDQDSAALGDKMIFPQGYNQILQPMLNDINILLNQKVKKIDYHNNLINVFTEDNCFQCEKVICTVPLGVLKKQVIEFLPTLPHYKMHAIKHLNMGVMNKIYIEFPEPFWQDFKGFLLWQQMHEHWCLVLDCDQYYQTPALLGFSYGQFAILLEQLSDEEILQKFTLELSKVFKRSIPKPSYFKITRWHQDPYSFGSYSYIPVGGRGIYYRDLARPVNNKIFFAGEATHQTFPSTVHGAHLSGISAALNIMAS